MLQLADEVEKLKEKNAQLAKEASFSSYFASVVEVCLHGLFCQLLQVTEFHSHF